MSEQFKVGEVVVLQGSISHPELNGTEGTILDCVGRMMFWNGTGMAYRVQFADGVNRIAASWTLRRKRPPKPAREMDTKVRWEDCAWMPMCVKLDRAIERAKQEA